MLTYMHSIFLSKRILAKNVVILLISMTSYQGQKKQGSEWAK